MEKFCLFCGKQLPNGRNGQMAYCSSACRQAAYRKRLIMRLPTSAKNEAEILDAIGNDFLAVHKALREYLLASEKERQYIQRRQSGQTWTRRDVDAHRKSKQPAMVIRVEKRVKPVQMSALFNGENNE